MGKQKTSGETFRISLRLSLETFPELRRRLESGEDVSVAVLAHLTKYELLYEMLQHGNFPFKPPAVSVESGSDVGVGGQVSTAPISEPVRTVRTVSETLPLKDSGQRGNRGESDDLGQNSVAVTVPHSDVSIPRAAGIDGKGNSPWDDAGLDAIGEFLDASGFSPDR